MKSTLFVVGSSLYFAVAGCSDGSALSRGSGANLGSTSGAIVSSSGGTTPISGAASGSAGTTGTAVGNPTSGTATGTGTSSGTSSGVGSGDTGMPSSGAGSGTTGSSGNATNDASVSGASTGTGTPEAGPETGTVAADPYSGPFHVLVLSLTKGFHHDSIPACHQLLRDLGKCVDAASCAASKDDVIVGTKPNSSFDVKVAGADPTKCNLVTDPNETTPGCDGNACMPGTSGNQCVQDPAKTAAILGEFAAQNLKNYQLLFFCNPTGDDFSSTGAAGQAGMQAIQDFMVNGGGYAGVHSATDFEQSNNFPFYTNVMTGAQFNTHNGDGTQGNVVVVPAYAKHPVVMGLPANWNSADEWYCMRKDINSIPGMTVLANLTGVPSPTGCTTIADPRPAIWIKEFPPPQAGSPLKGRVVYTIRGHNILRFTSEPLMRRLVHQEILWATHRLEQQ